MTKLKEIVARVFEEVAREEMHSNAVKANKSATPMTVAEITSVTALINCRAYMLNINKDTIECALHEEFRDWVSHSENFQEVIKWLVDYSGLN